MSRLKSVWTLTVVLGFLGWAAPASAQLLLNIGPTLNGALGTNQFTLQASGGSGTGYHYSITPGFTAPPGFRVQDGLPLPTNILVNASGTGAFLGVATTSGTFVTSIRVTDSAATVLDKPITLNIPPLQFTVNPPKITVGVAYSYTFTGFGGSGGAGYSWSATSLPAGLNLSLSGVLSGIPGAIVGNGVVNAIVTLTDSTLSPPLNSVQRTVTMTVEGFAITTPGLLPTATGGVFYTQTLTAPGCTPSCSWAVNTGIPGGLTLSSAGVLSGTPFLQTGSLSVTAQASNGTSATKIFSLFVTSPTTPLSSGFNGFGDTTVGNFVANQILPFGGTPPYSASLVSGTLPPGVSLVPSVDTLCAPCSPGLPFLYGRAMQAGTYTFTLKLMDSAGGSFTPAPYTWRISPLNNFYFNLPLTGTIPAGVLYSQPLLVAGGSNNYTFTAVTPLPAGLSIDSNTGVISGTPTLGGRVTSQILITDALDTTVKFNAFINVTVSGPPTVVTLPATIVTNTSAVLNGNVNPGGFATTGFYEWGPTSAYGNTTSVRDFGLGFNSLPHTVGLTGLTCVAGSVYHFRLQATNSQGTSFGADQTFTCSPQVFTNNPNNIGAFTARLNGSANPNGLATTGQYQWGLTTAYGNVTPVQSLGSGVSFQFIDGGTLTGLQCSTTYHFRATATNANGTSNGNDLTFQTLPCTPGTFTGVIAAVGQTNATLLGGANPNGQLTNAHFQWGATTAYGNVTSDQAMGSGFVGVPMATVPISGLTCGTTYHFRAVATNSFGTATGFDRAFATAPCAATPITGTVYTLNGYPFTNLIYGFGVTSSGALVQIPGFPVMTGGLGQDDVPEQLTYDAGKKRLYAINSDSATLSVFNVDPRTGALTQAPFSPIVLPAGSFWTTVHVHPSGSPVVVGGIIGNPDDPATAVGTVASYVITPTTATAAAGSPYTPGVAFVFSSAFSRDGSYVYAGAGSGSPDATTAGFAVNAANGVLTPLAGSPFGLGGMFPIGYATDGSGRLFSVNNDGNQVRAFTTAGGVPTAVAGNPFAAPGMTNSINGVFNPLGFYMAADEGNKIGVYQIADSGSTTTLTNVAGSPFATGGQDTTSLAVSKDGRFVFATNAASHNLTVFSVNASTGALTTVFMQPPNTLADNGYAASVTFAPSGGLTVDDVDGDGKTDVAIFRPSTGTWWMLQSSSNYTTYVSQTWGIATDVPVPGDYDGDGKADVAVYRPSTGTWWILKSSTNYTTYMSQAWGISTDVPVPGDYDGDGKTDIAIYRPSTGTWWILKSSSNYTTYISQTWGISTDVPVAGDFDGDGKTDLAIFRASTGTWWILKSSTNFTTYMSQTWGISTDVPVPGDYDGDGVTDVAIFRPSTGTWWILKSSTNFTTYMSQAWGISTDVPVPGDYDGDGKTDLAIYRPSTGTWWILKSSSNYTTYISQTWGVGTDLPLNHRP